MKRVKVCFRLEESLYLELKKQSDNVSKLVRRTLLIGLSKSVYVRREEIDELIKANEILRKAAVNFNQAVRALNVAVVQNETVKADVSEELIRTSHEIHLLRNALSRLIGKYYDA